MCGAEHAMLVISLVTVAGDLEKETSGGVHDDRQFEEYSPF